MRVIRLAAADADDGGAVAAAAFFYMSLSPYKAVENDV